MTVTKHQCKIYFLARLGVSTPLGAPPWLRARPILRCTDRRAYMQYTCCILFVTRMLILLLHTLEAITERFQSVTASRCCQAVDVVFTCVNRLHSKRLMTFWPWPRSFQSVWSNTSQKAGDFVLVFELERSTILRWTPGEWFFFNFLRRFKYLCSFSSPQPEKIGTPSRRQNPGCASVS